MKTPKQSTWKALFMKGMRAQISAWTEMFLDFDRHVQLLN